MTDHGNGGMTIGNKATDNDYDKRTLDEFLEPLKKATRTGEGVEKLFNADFSNAAEVMALYYGITDLTAEEIEAIKNTETGSMNYTVGPMISKERTSAGQQTVTRARIFRFTYTLPTESISSAALWKIRILPAIWQSFSG